MKKITPRLTALLHRPRHLMVHGCRMVNRRQALRIAMHETHGTTCAWITPQQRIQTVTYVTRLMVPKRLPSRRCTSYASHARLHIKREFAEAKPAWSHSAVFDQLRADALGALRLHMQLLPLHTMLVPMS